jgi:prepilin peptidase CpaA
MQTAILIVGLGVLAIIAYGDMRSRRIPNALSLAIAILGLLRIMLVYDPVTAGHTLAAGAATFTAAFLLFWYGAIGGGDAKLVAAAVLLVGYHDVFGFLFLMSLCGGVLALTSLAADRFDLSFRRRPRGPNVSAIGQSDRDRVGFKGSTVPYGVAIATAGVITLIAGR